MLQKASRRWKLRRKRRRGGRAETVAPCLGRIVGLALGLRRRKSSPVLLHILTLLAGLGRCRTLAKTLLELERGCIGDLPACHTPQSLDVARQRARSRVIAR
jgi:hypothetical protein